MSLNSHAFSDKTAAIGIGYLAENSMGRITKTTSGQPNAMIGTTTFPLILKYDWSLNSNWFLSPSLAYTILDRDTAGGSSKVNLWHLVFAFGENFSSGQWDWYVGPGLLSRTIKGSGGTTVLSNGNGTATFSLPGRSSTSRVMTINTGISYSFDNSRLGFELISEGLLSDKRTFSFMLNYTYSFWRGY